MKINKKQLTIIVEQEIGRYIGENDKYHIPMKYIGPIQKAIKSLVDNMQPLDAEKLFAITYAISLITSELTAVNYNVSKPKLAKQIGRVWANSIKELD